MNKFNYAFQKNISPSIGLSIPFTIYNKQYVITVKMTLFFRFKLNVKIATFVLCALFFGHPYNFLYLEINERN
jgi:hypothetical protein